MTELQQRGYRDQSANAIDADLYRADSAEGRQYREGARQARRDAEDPNARAAAEICPGFPSAAGVAKIVAAHTELVEELDRANLRPFAIPLHASAAPAPEVPPVRGKGPEPDAPPAKARKRAKKPEPDGGQLDFL